MTQHHILKDLNPQQHKREDLIIPFNFGWPNKIMHSTACI